MAQNKKSFLLYADLINTVEKLTDQKAGKLFKTILQYVNDRNPVVEDLLLQVAFEPIKQQLKRDLKDWEQEREGRSLSGRLGNLKRWHPDLYGKVVTKAIDIKEAEEIAKDRIAIKPIANVAVTDTVNVTVTDNVIERDKSSVFYSIEQCLQIAIADNRWVKANKTSEPELKEFNKLLEKRGVYEKNPLDYKTHFANWKNTGKKDELQQAVSTESPKEKKHREMMRELTNGTNEPK